MAVFVHFAVLKRAAFAACSTVRSGDVWTQSRRG
jgi:hypothetical protein